MPDIRILPDRVANQIAAGEVIERPAAVVKELVENALDAGATRIEVEFRHGGRSLMRVEDNGHGMNRDNALLSLERHATSKISEAVDLDVLGSFGFRGEAVPSIASVSKFTLQTRAEGEELGTEVLVNGGRLVHVRECGRPVGTRIEVAHLFNSVPARRKFLKRDQTEAAHIVAGVRLYALASPGVAFTLIEDGRVIFRSPECPALVDRVAEIFGRQLAEQLVPITAAEGSMSLDGLIGKPGVGRSTRHEMIVFVNGRPVDNRTLNYALIESYHESLPKGRYPPAFVFFNLPPNEVDVNVHPAKREVRFRSEPAVRSFVIRSVLERLRALRGDAGAPGRDDGLEPLPPAELRPISPPSASSSTASQHSGIAARAPSPAPVQSSRPAAAPAGSGGATPSLGPLRQVPGKGPPVEGVRPAAEASHAAGGRGWRFVGMAHGVYGLFETGAGIVMLHRRSAHERVWFERLQAEFRAGKVASQRLLLAVPVELDPIAAALLLDRLGFLQSHGFEIAEFGRNFFRIEAVPDWMEPNDAESFLRDLLGALRDGRFPEDNPDLAHDELARLAAAKAVRLPEQTGEVHWMSLVSQLFACRTPLTSPAGRPTFVEMSHGELARRFQK
ncbi:DNA mismatch repair endonuclease MutL [Actomonas aquatica]|uniref:DNA mismatch repair protein MutL n=1 Tax=Actomonas aquatica TaxID=2866162 RepID=A0ABZ1CD61_9BACT|nr:DNA mismatch repair endonuclease MutL [Opitutus sp. WL0086]WRQ89494.1 DNA mismatch repair endonuclease MutL [Opitutus sp. WL0086]